MVSQILDKVFQLNAPKIDEARRLQINDFVASAINGDVPKANIVINCHFPNNRSGAMIYVLTNVRLIVIGIDEKEIKSSSILINNITNIERQLEGTRSLVKIYYQNENVWLRYSADNQEVNNFFQEVDKVRIVKPSASEGHV